MTTYTDALLVYNNGKLQKISSSDNVAVSGNVNVGGNLTVQGQVVSAAATTVLAADNFIDLSSGYSSNTAERPAGFTFNVKASGTAKTGATFTAGVVATSAPKITCTGAPGFSNGDIIQVGDATNPLNNGLFIVNSVSGNDIILYGVGGTAVPSYALFCQNQLATDATTNAAVVTKVDLAVLAICDGSALYMDAPGDISVGKLVRCYHAAAVESNFAGGWIEVGAAVAPSSLQNAYDVGNTIAMTAGKGSLTVSTSSGNAGVLLDATGVRSNFTVTNERLDLKSVGARAGGTQVLVQATNSAGASQAIVEADSSALMQTPTGAGAKYYFESAATASTPFVAMEAEDNTAGIYIGSTAHNSFVAIGSDGVRNISIGNTNGATAVDILAGTGGVDVTGALSVSDFVKVGASAAAAAGNAGAVRYASGTFYGSDGTSWNAFVTGTVASTLQDTYNNSTSPATITLAGSKNLVVAAPGSGTAAITLGANAASSFSVAGANLSLHTTTSGALDLASAGALTLDAVGVLELNSSGAAISIGNDAVAQDINVGTGAAARTVTVGSTDGNSDVHIEAANSFVSVYSDAAGTGWQGIWGKAASVNGEVWFAAGAALNADPMYPTELYLNDQGYAGLNANVDNHTVQISAGWNSGTVDVAVGNANKTLNLGTTYGTSTTNINAGSGGVNVTGTLTGSSYLRTGQFATGSLPSASGIAGAMAYDSTLGLPVFSDGTSWLNQLVLAQTFQLNAAASSGIVKGNVLVVGVGSGDAGLADNDNASANEPVAIAYEAASSGGGLFRVQAAVGLPAYMKFKSGEAPTGAGDIGKVVYLSNSPGEATLVAPSATGSRVYRLGILKSNTAVSGLYEVVYLPAFIADL